MKSFSAAVFFLLHLSLAAQFDEHNILNRDSFPHFVKTVTLTAYLHSEEKNEPMSSRYYELDTTGAWNVFIETFSDGDVSYDSVKWNTAARTRTITKSNDFEPGRMVTTYNADGTVKSVLNQPGQREPQLTEFEYDYAKRVTKKKLTFVENLTVETYVYDMNGRIVNRKRSSGAVTAKTLQLDYEEKYDYQQQGDDYVVYALYYGAGEAVRTRDTVFYMFNEQHLLKQKLELIDNHKWDRLTEYEYDASGRVKYVLVQSMENGEEYFGNTRIEYDSMGYYETYVQEESNGTGYSNRWTTHYNERGLPVETYFTTPAEIFYYEWKYEYR